MKINVEIMIRDDEWNELSEEMKERYLSKLSYRLEVAASSVGEDLAILLFNTKPFKVNDEV